MSSPLEHEFEFYLANQDELVKEHAGKFIVIKDLRVIGVYSTQQEAINETKKQYELGSFLVQLVTPGSSAYTQTFHSRVAFQ